MNRSFLLALSLVVSGQALLPTAHAESPVYCAATAGAVECKGGELTPEYRSLGDGPCGEAVRAHCQAQYTKDLRTQIDQLTEAVLECGTDRAVAFDTIGEKNEQLRRLRRLVRRSRR
jgi:hypothetical protein